MSGPQLEQQPVLGDPLASHQHTMVTLDRVGQEGERTRRAVTFDDMTMGPSATLYADEKDLMMDMSMEHQQFCDQIQAALQEADDTNAGTSGYVIGSEGHVANGSGAIDTDGHHATRQTGDLLPADTSGFDFDLEEGDLILEPPSFHMHGFDEDEEVPVQTQYSATRDTDDIDIQAIMRSILSPSDTGDGREAEAQDQPREGSAARDSVNSNAFIESNNPINPAASTDPAISKTINDSRTTTSPTTFIDPRTFNSKATDPTSFIDPGTSTHNVSPTEKAWSALFPLEESNTQLDSNRPCDITKDMTHTDASKHDAAEQETVQPDEGRMEAEELDLASLSVNDNQDPMCHYLPPVMTSHDEQLLHADKDVAEAYGAIEKLLNAEVDMFNDLEQSTGNDVLATSAPTNLNPDMTLTGDQEGAGRGLGTAEMSEEAKSLIDEGHVDIAWRAPPPIATTQTIPPSSTKSPASASPRKAKLDVLANYYMASPTRPHTNESDIEVPQQQPSPPRRPTTASPHRRRSNATSPRQPHRHFLYDFDEEDDLDGADGDGMTTLTRLFQHLPTRASKPSDHTTILLDTAVPNPSLLDPEPRPPATTTGLTASRDTPHQRALVVRALQHEKAGLDRQRQKLLHPDTTSHEATSILLGRVEARIGSVQQSLEDLLRRGPSGTSSDGLGYQSPFLTSDTTTTQPSRPDQKGKAKAAEGALSEAQSISPPRTYLPPSNHNDASELLAVQHPSAPRQTEPADAMVQLTESEEDMFGANSLMDVLERGIADEQRLRSLMQHRASRSMSSILKSTSGATSEASSPNMAKPKLSSRSSTLSPHAKHKTSRTISPNTKADLPAHGKPKKKAVAPVVSAKIQEAQTRAKERLLAWKNLEVDGMKARHRSIVSAKQKTRTPISRPVPHVKAKPLSSMTRKPLKHASSSKKKTSDKPRPIPPPRPKPKRAPPPVVSAPEPARASPLSDATILRIHGCHLAALLISNADNGSGKATNGLLHQLLPQRKPAFVVGKSASTVTPSLTSNLTRLQTLLKTHDVWSCPLCSAYLQGLHQENHMLRGKHANANPASFPEALFVGEGGEDGDKRSNGMSDRVTQVIAFVEREVDDLNKHYNELVQTYEATKPEHEPDFYQELQKRLSNILHALELKEQQLRMLRKIQAVQEQQAASLYPRHRPPLQQHQGMNRRETRNVSLSGADATATRLLLLREAQKFQRDTDRLLTKPRADAS